MAWKMVGSEKDYSGKPEVLRNYVLDSSSDIDSPPEDDYRTAPGSCAYTADLTGIWVKSPAGVWTAVGG